MLYPKIENIKKDGKTFYFISFLNLLLCIIIVIINFFISKNINWSIIASLGILFIGRTIFIVLNQNKNLALFIFVQMIYLSLLLFSIDFIFGDIDWSLLIGSPILIIVSNFSMILVNIIRYKKYLKYALYEIMILVLSILYEVILWYILKKISILNGIAFWICISNLALVLSLNTKTLILEFKKNFHI